MEERATIKWTAVTDQDVMDGWHELATALSRLCLPSYSFKDIAPALDKEVLGNPIVKYIADIVYNYCHYFAFGDLS
ncbi:hypothetical protein BGX29_003094 [Mortierella sp. GBA35]|nr:hypothetical protein BGX23_002921 [Mortierella sp. AD031]KAF9083536.1 hypothetical protein BGX29_003094 [Mortierella sp. GBA35]KAG0196847.1 hypothetical protein BGX33_001215 [Mortierella sp. NVP41]